MEGDDPNLTKRICFCFCFLVLTNLQINLFEFVVLTLHPLNQAKTTTKKIWTLYPPHYKGLPLRVLRSQLQSQRPHNASYLQDLSSMTLDKLRANMFETKLRLRKLRKA